MTKYGLAESDGITELCSGPGYMRNKYPIASFEDNLFLPFEGTEMPIPVGYDAYLSTAFWGLYDTATSRQASTAS